MQPQLVAKIVIRHRLERADLNHTGVVDENIDFAEAFRGICNKRLRRPLVAQIARKSLRLDIAPPQVGKRAFQIFFGARADCDTCAALTENARELEA